MPNRLSVMTGSAKGQLDVEVTTTAKVIHRGEQLNVDISIQNGNDQNVEIVSWDWQLPAWVYPNKSPAEDKLPVLLHPNDSFAISIPIWSERPFWALGSLHYPSIEVQTSKFNIEYKLGVDEHKQVVPVTLEIHASSVEIYLAAIVGGIIGSLVNTLTPGVGTLVSGVLGLVLVLIAQRRSNVQLGISIEDAIGGFVVGFLVGYVGTSYFKGFLPIT